VSEKFNLVGNWAVIHKLMTLPMAIIYSQPMGHSMSNTSKVLTSPSQILMISGIPVSFDKKIRSVTF